MYFFLFLKYKRNYHNYSFRVLYLKKSSNLLYHCLGLCFKLYKYFCKRHTFSSSLKTPQIVAWRWSPPRFHAKNLSSCFIVPTPNCITYNWHKNPYRTVFYHNWEGFIIVYPLCKTFYHQSHLKFSPYLVFPHSSSIPTCIWPPYDSWVDQQGSMFRSS